MNLTQKRFLGFVKTPNLWSNKVLGLEQMKSLEQINPPNFKITDTIRLGNYVEQLSFYELSQNQHIKIIAKNLQINNDKRTLGEIDCLLYDNYTPIHLEIAYKFYLFDNSLGDDFLEKWIGPNRRDSLILKLNKIKTKQFPLLYSNTCSKELKEMNLSYDKIQQRVLFKAQLYIPYKSKIELQYFEKQTIFGYYINIKQLNDFNQCKFYIPKKIDWLLLPEQQVDWISFEKVKTRIKGLHQKKNSPLCWIKQHNGEIHKVFVVWW